MAEILRLPNARGIAKPAHPFGRLTQGLECLLHTEEVAGSNPASPTTSLVAHRHEAFLLDGSRKLASIGGFA